ncbi:hypothetical protein BDV98DRAFT_653896 [Pterulicium gracile]|uniref:DUF1993 domain-containing protein n=1 Tax=Pterulicium gracile TaxID=1884261 RepID=A0A5C3QVA9_9AGAR|nr:hypothetical protein BDV98DRAFT_653896 [Pterula gracilis]
MSLYTQSVPVLIKYLDNLSKIVQKGAAFAEEKGIKAEDVLHYRLIADQQTLIYQVRAICNSSKAAVSRLGVEAPFVEDNEQTFDDLVKRIEHAIQLLEDVDAAIVDAAVDREVIMETRMGNFYFKTGQQYISEYAIPNFHFHMSTAYCILCAQGVQLGAMDYLNNVFTKHEP